MSQLFGTAWLFDVIVGKKCCLVGHFPMLRNVVSWFKHEVMAKDLPSWLFKHRLHDTVEQVLMMCPVARVCVCVIKREKLVSRKCGNAVGWLAAGEFASGRDGRSQGHLASVRRCDHFQHWTPWTRLLLRVGETNSLGAVTVGDQLLTLWTVLVSFADT